MLDTVNEAVLWTKMGIYCVFNPPPYANCMFKLEECSLVSLIMSNKSARLSFPSTSLPNMTIAGTHIQCLVLTFDLTG